MNDGRLRGAVGVSPEAGLDAGDAGGADDAARALLPHYLRRVLHPQEDASEVHRYRLVPAFHRDLVDQATHARSPGVVEDAVQPAQLVDGKADHCPDVILLGHINMKEVRALAQLLGNAPPALVLHVPQDDARPLRHEQPRRSPANSAGRSRDGRNLAVQLPHGGVPLLAQKQTPADQARRPQSVGA